MFAPALVIAACPVPGHQALARIAESKVMMGTSPIAIELVHLIG